MPSRINCSTYGSPIFTPPPTRCGVWDVTRKQELAAPQILRATDLPLDLDAKSLTVTSNTPRKPDAWENVLAFGSHFSTAMTADGKVKAVRDWSLPVSTNIPDGKWKTLPSPRDVKLVEAATGKVLHVLQGYEQWVCRLAFSPDGKTLAMGNHNGTIRLWNVAAGRLMLTLPAHAGPVNGLAFRADGPCWLRAATTRSAFGRRRRMKKSRGGTNDRNQQETSP